MASSYLTLRHEKNFQLLIMHLTEILQTYPNHEGVPMLPHIRISTVHESLDEALEDNLIYVHCAFKVWAEREVEEGRLLLRENWRTHHNYESYWIMHTIYRYLFPHDGDFYQVRISPTSCQDTTHQHAIPFYSRSGAPHQMTTMTAEFELSLYGWADEGQMRTPWETLPLSIELPESDWNPPWSRYEDTKYG
jgi:hypothetical protein